MGKTRIFNERANLCFESKPRAVREIQQVFSTMTSHKCYICGSTSTNDPNVSFYRFPNESKRRALWLQVFETSEEDISRVCSQHFPEGDVNKIPSLTVCKHFAS